MNKIEKVKIEDFWGDKTVTLKLKDDVNFLIGVNGSGKTTIINLIAATLKADFSTLDRFQFKKINISLKPLIVDSKAKKTAFIEVEKTDKTSSPYPNIIFKIKRYNDTEAKKYLLDELEEEHMFRYSNDFLLQRRIVGGPKFERDVNVALQELINVSWLSIHRATTSSRRREERSFESTIDQKIEELQIELVKYFSQLNRRYAIETEKFQKYIFESLIDKIEEDAFAVNKKIDAEKEKNSLKQIFVHFQLNERSVNTKLDNYFDSYNKSLVKLTQTQRLDMTDLAYLLGTRKIHSVVQEWSKVIDKQKSINKSRETFLLVINNLLQRKHLFINEKNELTVKTQSGKIFPLTNLSSGEKQLLIILGQSLLQEENVHIYIADEPELSLHVEWQEKLVSSLKSVNPNSQIIFATHSPDIVGEFNDSVIKVEEAIK